MLDSSFVFKLLEYDYKNRLTQIASEQSSSPWFYITVIKDSFYPWLYFLPLGLVFIFKIYKRYKTDDFLLILVSFFTILLIFSIAQTKNFWYILPVFPIMAITVSIAGAVIWVRFSELRFNKILLAVLTSFLLVNMVSGVLNASLFINAQNDLERNGFSTLINQEFIKKDILSSDVIVHKAIIEQSQSNLFYLEKLLDDKFSVSSEVLCDLNKDQLWIISIPVDFLRKLIETCPDRNAIATYHRGANLVYAIIK
jgi:hypothetical protein